MNVRMVAVDVDGTLLNSRKELTSPVQEAIEAVKAQGILFTIATGRDICGLTKLQHLISPGSPVITYNGAELRLAGSGELLSSICLPEESAMEIVRHGLELGFTAIVWSKGVLYIGQAGPWSRGYAEMYGIEALPLTQPEALAKQGVTKVIWAGEPGEIGSLEEKLQRFPISGAECCTSDLSYLEFMAQGVNKGSGLRAAAEALGLRREEVMAVGDGHNDIPMLRWAAFSVAMGNASEEVKCSARFVTESCDRDGLAAALNALLSHPLDNRKLIERTGDPAESAEASAFSKNLPLFSKNKP